MEENQKVVRGISKRHCNALVNLAKYLDIYEVSVVEQKLEETNKITTNSNVFDRYIEIVGKMVTNEVVYGLHFSDGVVYFLTDRDGDIRCFVETGDFSDDEDDYDIFDMGKDLSPKFLLQHIYLNYSFTKNILKNSIEKKIELLQEDN